MKYSSSIIIISVLLMMFIFIPTTCADPAIMISDYTLTPEVLMPGDSALLTLTVTNAETTATRTTATTSGGTTTTTVKTNGVEIDNIWIVAAESGGKHISATLNYPDIGYLAPGASFDVSFKLVAEENIPEGLYFPTARIDVETYEDVQYPIPIKVNNASVELLSTEMPSRISLSGSSEVTFTVVNNRDVSVDGVSVTPNETEGIDVLPTSVFIGTLAPDTSQDVMFSLKPNELGVKNLSFEVRFKNGDNEHTETFTSSLEIIDTLDVGSIFTSIPRSIQKGGSSRITLEVYNAKTESITGVMVTPISNATVLPSQYFIGSMEPDDVFSASFDIYTDTLDLGTHSIAFAVSFKQGNEYYETPTIRTSYAVVSGEGSTYQSTEGTSDQLQGQPFGNILGVCLPIIGVIVAIIAIVILLKWKKRRNTR